MKLGPALLLASLACAFGAPAEARDDKRMEPIEAALALPDAKEKLDPAIRFYFGDQKTPKVLQRLGEDVANRKTNSFGKSAEFACQWAFLSALIGLQDRAKELGANAVVNVVSDYKKVEFSSTTEYECHDGTFVSGVALKGTFVKLAE